MLKSVDPLNALIILTNVGDSIMRGDSIDSSRQPGDLLIAEEAVIDARLIDQPVQVAVAQTVPAQNQGLGIGAQWTDRVGYRCIQNSVDIQLDY